MDKKEKRRVRDGAGGEGKLREGERGTSQGGEGSEAGRRVGGGAEEEEKEEEEEEEKRVEDEAEEAGRRTRDGAEEEEE